MNKRRTEHKLRVENNIEHDNNIKVIPGWEFFAVNWVRRGAELHEHKCIYCNRFKLQMCTVPSPIHLVALHLWKGVKNVKLRRVWQISLHQWNEHRQKIHSTTFFFFNGSMEFIQNTGINIFAHFHNISHSRRDVVVVLQNSRARREGEFNFNLCNYIAVALSAAARGHGMIARSVTMRTTTTCSVPRSLSRSTFCDFLNNWFWLMHYQC